MKKTVIVGGVASLGLILGLVAGSAAAQMPHDMNGMNHSQPEQTEPFQHIEQSPTSKAIVTLGGLGLIGLELWWFLFSKPNSTRTQ